MLNLNDLSRQIARLRQGHLSLDDFEDWFRDNSRGAYACNDPGVAEACSFVESVLSEYHFENAPEALACLKLERFIIIPIGELEHMYGDPVEFSYGTPKIRTESANLVTA